MGGGRDGGHLPPAGGQDDLPAQTVGISGQTSEGRSCGSDGGLGLSQLPRDRQDQVNFKVLQQHFYTIVRSLFIKNFKHIFIPLSIYVHREFLEYLTVYLLIEGFVILHVL